MFFCTGFLTKIRDNTSKNTPKALECMLMLRDMESKLSTVRNETEFGWFLHWYKTNPLQRFLSDDVRMQSIFYEKTFYGVCTNRDYRKITKDNEYSNALYETGSIDPIDLAMFTGYKVEVGYSFGK